MKEFTPEEQQEYVCAVIKKQAGVSDEEAQAMASSLTEDQFKKLHDAGRAGKVAKCLEVIAEASKPAANIADVPDEEKPHKRKSK